MQKIIFISAVKDFNMYNNVIKNNPFVIGDNIVLSPIDNNEINLGLSKRYNDFLSSYNYVDQAWLVFCHEDWNILESISKKLDDLDRNALYGSFGARLIKKDDICIREYIGHIYDCAKDGKNLRRLGSEFENLLKVDVLDCQSLIVHSSLVEKFNLRFDEELEFDLYVEDFCLNAFVKNGLESKVLNLEVCHHSQIMNISERENCTKMCSYLNEKYKNYTFAGIVLNIGKNTDKIITKDLVVNVIDEQYRSKIYETDIISENDARFIMINYINPDSKILDVGCACGDFGFALKKKKPATLWGMEYNQGSIDFAKQKRAYSVIYKIDLNNFNSLEFKQFSGFFDYIIFGDVLEHIYSPQKTLSVFKEFLKDDGSFLLSIPNIAHASIKANLLLDDFTYTPFGLLDETHIRFFTKKTIPVFLANIDLEIEKNNITYQNKIGCQSTDPYIELSAIIKKQIFSDFHSYVLQYVMKVKKSNLAQEKIVLANASKLIINKENSPDELNKLRNHDLFEVETQSKDELILRDQELALMKSSKFWKIREEYIRIKNIFTH